MKITVTMPLNESQRTKLEAAAPGAEFLYCVPMEKAQEAVTMKAMLECQTQEQFADAEVILGNVKPRFLAGAKSLKWLQLNNAGTEGFCDGALPEGAILTNATGAYGLAISEHMIGMLFELRKKLHLYRDNQSEHLWRSEGHVGVIEGTTVLVLGLGDIGTTFARKMKALGCYTIGVKRRPGACPAGVDELHLLEDLDELLPRADVVALSMPGNAQTRHTLDGRRLGLLKENAVILNVGRGSAIDTDALTEALQAGKIAGAGLDVTDPEPLPSDHPLWEAPGVVITPHVSGGFSLPETLEKIVDICAENLIRYQKGEPLRNVVDLETGYCK
ncbi:MAG: D-2-hydroxyacid dehydrogenase [Lachnospiraceae bacterium]|nr:D-2-hydroxyacid dehydrogenase [Lachnospiraceae bacterium]